MEVSRDTGAPRPSADLPNITHGSVRAQLIAGEPLAPRKQGRDAKGGYLSTSERQTKVAKIKAAVTYENSTKRSRVKKALYYNLYAAMGMDPLEKKQSGHRSHGSPFEDLLCFMLRRVVMHDGSTFSVENDSTVGFIIHQVYATQIF